MSFRQNRKVTLHIANDGTVRRFVKSIALIQFSLNQMDPLCFIYLLIPEKRNGSSA
jgi:hypothetical protein